MDQLEDRGTTIRRQRARRTAELEGRRPAERLGQGPADLQGRMTAEGLRSSKAMAGRPPLADHGRGTAELQGDDHRTSRGAAPCVGRGALHLQGRNPPRDPGPPGRASPPFWSAPDGPRWPGKGRRIAIGGCGALGALEAERWERTSLAGQGAAER